MSDITKPSVLQKLCEQYRLHPAKGYGQNFLITDAPIEKMIEAAELKDSDTVVEIGPGFGVLTFALAERVKKVMAFEIERKLGPYWESVLKDQKIGRSKDHEIEIVWGNALSHISHITYHISRYKVVANLPYQITSDVLRTLLELENKPEMIVIMVQKEVAERMCARPRSAFRQAQGGEHGRTAGSRQAGGMSLLSVAVQYYGKPEIIARVPSGSFWPRPKVESAILRITLAPKHASTLAQRERDKEFFRVVRAGFAMKRKMLWGNLAKGLKLDGEKVKEILREVVGNDKVRAEEVSVGEWSIIVERLKNSPLPS